jgi:CheY-like chemotaxis protein
VPGDRAAIDGLARLPLNQAVACYPACRFTERQIHSTSPPAYPCGGLSAIILPAGDPAGGRKDNPLPHACGGNPADGQRGRKESGLADILIVDDDANVRSVMREILVDEGHQVTEAPNGRAALEALSNSSTPVVVVLDMRLPDMEGLTVLARIRESGPEAARRHAFILCTAGRLDLIEKALQQLGEMQVSLLAKPFDIDELVKVVESAAQRIATSEEERPGGTHTDKQLPPGQD